jgi:hypothetical protein
MLLHLDAVCGPASYGRALAGDCAGRPFDERSAEQDVLWGAELLRLHLPNGHFLHAADNAAD